MKIKPLTDNFIKPEYKSAAAGGMDIYFQEDVTLTAGKDNVVKLGFAAEVPPGHVALLLPRSGAGARGIALRNTAGVIDSDYRGEWIAHIVVDANGDNFPGREIPFRRGERAIQCLIVPVAAVTVELADELSETARGAGGFGSTK